MKDMSEYDKLLKNARIAARLSAKHFVPQLHEALLKENPKMTLRDVRERIEKDCIEFWSKRTILDALPPEAKDPVKQKAGIQSRKAFGKRLAANSAAEIVTPASEKREILVTVDGHEHIGNDNYDSVVKANSYMSEQKGDHPIGDVHPADTMAATISEQVMKGASSSKDETMTFEISMRDKEIDSYRLSRPADDELAKITRIHIQVDRLTEKVIGVGVGKAANGGEL